mmetsp:Transcript_43324/g.86089  ORF Transcript_43324/g.86089 Transcript_43324/m.86089 type:complete len:115 (-) Transcript_43324:26-370(-)|eukprot:CAMPEP_0170394566 /NCGR_PEP_ID=MMETSP0117_2-20130122/21323_1 /TAXON_ID=400756 /ORGANISM="Durinskia baltica, Strain CSIRO CS-38" /LENGTH=114 /DNA_ID=CAMNT_0010650837 /DNA_START=14 /DNA_END=358 /DNA_ORIENTATION=-
MKVPNKRPMKRKGGFKRPNDGSKPKSAREEIEEIMETVKSFNAKSLEGAKKAAHKDDRLTKLGALPPKQQKMPYAMRIGLNAAKKKREIRDIQLAKESQVQLPQSYVQNKKRKK